MQLDDGLRATAECRLTTTGRSSGQPRRVALWFAAVGDRVYFLAGGREAAHWVRNVQGDPTVTVEIGARTFEGQARVVEGTADDPVAREAMGVKYGTRYLTAWLRDALPVAVDLEREID